MGDADLKIFLQPTVTAHVFFQPEMPFDWMGGGASPCTPCLPPFQPLTPPVRPSLITRGIDLISFSQSSDNYPSTEPPGSWYEPIDTPPGSEPGTVTSVSVSTAFHLHARLLSIPPDIILVTQDGVLFYVHTTKLISISKNSFNKLPLPKRDAPLPVLPETLISVPEHSAVLNIVLHCVYDLSCALYHPSLDTLSIAVDAMAAYGITPKDNIVPSKPLFALILNQAPIQPILAYSIAASHDILDIAVPVSSHTLSTELKSISDADAAKIGPIYLRRLFFLHLGRLEALRTLLLPPPYPHPCTSTCDFARQKQLTRAWALASAYIAWEARPGALESSAVVCVSCLLLNHHGCTDLSVSTIEAMLGPLADDLQCELCKKTLAERVKRLIVQWSMVKVRLVAEKCHSPQFRLTNTSVFSGIQRSI